MNQITNEPSEIEKFLKYTLKVLSILGEQYPNRYPIGTDGILNTYSRDLYEMQKLGFLRVLYNQVNRTTAIELTEFGYRAYQSLIRELDATLLNPRRLKQD